MKKPIVRIIIPCWKRADIFQKVVKQLDVFCSKNKSKAQISVVYVFSPEDEELKQLFKIYNSAKHERCVVCASNNLLGSKHNAGINKANELGFDYIMNMGSDDLLHPALIDFYLPYMHANVKFFGVNKLFFYDSVKNETLFFSYYNYPAIVGAGRMIHKEIIETVLLNYDGLYEADLKRGMDGFSAKRIESCGYSSLSLDPGQFPFVVDIKSETNINSYDRIQNNLSRTASIIKVDSSILSCIFKNL